ncbi:hypothetical protein LZ32DRAFT_650357 [Colletotrichum eremochloae]|nr:hypothetical protein LZ32DRAFT_650357 [Colletotrichum eremochloae]
MPRGLPFSLSGNPFFLFFVEERGGKSMSLPLPLPSITAASLLPFSFLCRCWCCPVILDLRGVDFSRFGPFLMLPAVSLITGCHRLSAQRPGEDLLFAQTFEEQGLSLALRKKNSLRRVLTPSRPSRPLDSCPPPRIHLKAPKEGRRMTSLSMRRQWSQRQSHLGIVTTTMPRTWVRTPTNPASLGAASASAEERGPLEAEVEGGAWRRGRYLCEQRWDR